MTVDYRQLLIKYIAHVLECEGADFISIGDSPASTVLTSDEKRELADLAKEAEKVRVSASEVIQ
jgi:hypothetical protein